MRVLDHVFLEEVPKDEESVLHLACEERSLRLDSIPKSDLVCHVEQEDVCSNTILPGMFLSKTVEDDAKFDLMIDILALTVMGHSERFTVRQEATRSDISQESAILTRRTAC